MNEGRFTLSIAVSSYLNAGRFNEHGYKTSAYWYSCWRLSLLVCGIKMGGGGLKLI